MPVLIEGVVKLLFPLHSSVPLVAALYQSITAPVEGVAESVTVPDPQRAPPVTEATVGNAAEVHLNTPGAPVLSVNDCSV